MEWTTLVTDSDIPFCEEFNNGSKKRKIYLSDAFGELFNHKISCKEILILAEKQETINLANRIGIPVVGLEAEAKISLMGTPYILQGLGAESFVLLERVYRRFYGLPVVIVETEHLYIREMMKSDTDPLFRLYHYKDVEKEVDQASLSKKELSEFIESYRRLRYPMYEYGMWIIEEKDTSYFVGEAGIEEDTHSDWRERKTGGICLEAGYVISPRFRRRGYATEALNGILRFVKEKKEEYQFEEICCYIRPENFTSIRIAERCGFLKNVKERYGKQKEVEQYYLKL